MRFLVLLLIAVSPVLHSAEVNIRSNGQLVADLVADTSKSVGDGPKILQDAARWLGESLAGVPVEIRDAPGEGSAVIIARGDAWPEIARDVGLAAKGYESYAIVTRPNRVFVLGNSEAAARDGVSDLLRRWGFRWFAPSPKWWVRPELREVKVDINTVETPALLDRRIWYAYGMAGEDLKPLMANYERWATANRLSPRSPIRTGHSYGNIIQRNAAAFEQHPDYFALLPDGKRDNTRSIQARKFCFSNPGLIRLVSEDRARLLAEDRKANAASYMVSVDPSDGEGTCHCESCKALGTTSDRVFHLANAVARNLRAQDPAAWVGLYAYSSHRLPPTISVEPNVYVQVAMGFNRTEFSLPELVERWSQKVSAIGLREYYGVEAWDWGLPGRARGGRVGYHREWIPFYAARRVNAINAETNANWGAQTPGCYVAAQLMWNPKADVEALHAEFLRLAFGAADGPMREFYRRMESAPALRPATLLPLFDDLRKADEMTTDEAVRARLTDLMAYLGYVAQFRQFDMVQSREPTRNDAYYAALDPLMNYAWRIRHRDTVHYYALARRLCNGLPLTDKRPEFYLADKGKPPVWQRGEPYTDGEIRAQFAATRERLRADPDPTVNFSRFLDHVKVPGADAGPCRIHADDREAVARFRRGLLGYLVPKGPQVVRLGFAPAAKPITVKVLERETVIFERTISRTGELQEVEINLPRAFEYRVEITGDFDLRVPADAPLVYEASPLRPAWVDYSGKHYFYVPRGTRELIVDADPRLSVMVPGKGRLDATPADRVTGANHIVIPVPEGADGQVWHTDTQTRGQFSLLNVPPLLSFHRQTTIVPREVAEAEGLSTGR